MLARDVEWRMYVTPYGEFVTEGKPGEVNIFQWRILSIKPERQSWLDVGHIVAQRILDTVGNGRPRWEHGREWKATQAGNRW